VRRLSDDVKFALKIINL